MTTDPLAGVRAPSTHTNDGASRTDERQKGRAMYMVTITHDEYKDLLHKTVGVTAYQRAARREEDASAAANKAVNDVLLGLDG